MKMENTIRYKRFQHWIIFLIAMFLLTSCSETKTASLVSEITGKIDSLKQVYAPDSRIALWNVSVFHKNNHVAIKGEVGNPNAQSALLNLRTKFPGTTFTIKLLPDSSITKPFALINNSVSSLRRKASRASEMLSQALLGTPVKVYKKEGEWYYIQTPNQYLGWVNRGDLALFDTASLRSYDSGKKIVFNRQCGFSYNKPDINSQVISDLVVGCILPVTGETKGFFKVKYPDGRIAFVRKTDVVSYQEFIHRKPTEKNLTETALKFNGIPYLWGGFSSKGIDCSGFSSLVYFLNGIILQRDASQQTKYGKEITTRYDYSALKPGDLLFFGRKAAGTKKEKVTHVAIYIGHSRFIHSSKRVHITSMDSLQPDYEKKYKALFVRAVRIIGQENGNTIQRINKNPLYQLIK
jgi:hypothetical protein